MLDKLKKIILLDSFNSGIIFFLAAFFSFFRISHQSLWNDESISAEFMRNSLQWIWDYVPKYDLHPPLYYAVLHFWQLIFGSSVVSIRGMSAIFFIGSSLLVYYFSKKLFKSKGVALITALIFITNPFAVLYAQEVRSYSMLIFFILLNSIFFYKINYEQNEKKSNFIIYFATAMVFIYTNILSLFVLMAHFLILLYLKNWKIFKKLFIVFVLLFVLYIPALRIIRSADEFDYSYYNAERFNIFLKTIVVFSGFIGARINVLNGKWHIYGLLAASLAAYGALFSILIYKLKEVNKFLLSFFVTSFILLIIAAHIKFPVPDPKYFYVVFPFFILLLGNIFMVLKKKWQIISVLIVIFSFNFVFLYNFYFVKKYEKENWKSVVSMIEADFLAEKNKTAVSISPVSKPHSTWAYYSTNIIPSDGALKYGNATGSINKAIDEINTPVKDIVYLSRFIYSLYDPTDAIRIYLEKHNYAKVKEIKDTKVEYWRYDRQQ